MSIRPSTSPRAPPPGRRRLQRRRDRRPRGDHTALRRLPRSRASARPRSTSCGSRPGRARAADSSRRRTQASEPCGSTTTRLALLAVAVLVGAAHEAAAADPWQLRCPSMPTEQPSPSALRLAALRFYPCGCDPRREPERTTSTWSRSTTPRYRATATTPTAARATTSTSHRALIAVAPSYAGSVIFRPPPRPCQPPRGARVLTRRRHALQRPQVGRDLRLPPAHVRHDPPDRSSRRPTAPWRSPSASSVAPSGFGRSPHRSGATSAPAVRTRTRPGSAAAPCRRSERACRPRAAG